MWHVEGLLFGVVYAKKHLLGILGLDFVVQFIRQYRTVKIHLDKYTLYSEAFVNGHSL